MRRRLAYSYAARPQAGVGCYISRHIGATNEKDFGLGDLAIRKFTWRC